MITRSGTHTPLQGVAEQEEEMQIPFVDLKAQYRSIQGEVLIALLNALDGMELLLGPNVRAFESEFAAYCRVGAGYELHTLQVFTVTAQGISRNSVFQDPEVFASFGLPAALDA